jgi:hypothetical protein
MACKEAIEKGIIVNTIHCGDGIPDDWRDGALLADGRSISINHNTRLVDIEAPQDREIARLGAELNRTYLPFGQAGTANQARQVAQDSNAAGQSLGSAVQRAVSKANAFYSNRSWDLVDAIREGQVQLANVKTEDLPENLRALTPVQRQAFVDGKAAERNRVQQRINELNGQRNQFVAAKRKELANAPGQETLDQALVQTIRSQALRKSYIFEGASK